MIYPFYAHVDFALCPRSINAGNFEQKLLKLQNGLFRFEKEVVGSRLATNYLAKAYTSVVKSGCRF